jgi:hypothetical protein
VEFLSVGYSSISLLLGAKQLNRAPRSILALSAFALCAACAVPHYDVPVDKAGQPTVASIVARVQCEIRDMVRDDRPKDPVTYNRHFLLDGDYDVEVSLSLEVNDTGGLTPSVSYVTPLAAAATTLTVAASGNLSESRDHNFTENIQLSTRKIYLDWKNGIDPHDCPVVADTFLAGALGISDMVAMANSTADLDESRKLSDAGVFGGSIQFVITKKLTATGPTWALVRFNNISALADLSEVNTDKITLAFALGPNVGKPMRLARSHNRYNPYAHQFLQQLLTSSINSQLTRLQNTLR